MNRSEHIVSIYKTAVPFSTAMRKELLKEKNLKKQHWSQDSTYSLIVKLHNKLHEMREREENKRLWGGRVDKARMRKLALDIANYAMMLHDNNKPKPRRKKAK